METIIVIAVVLAAAGFLLFKLKKRVKNPFDCECTGNCDGCKFANDKQNRKDNDEKINAKDPNVSGSANTDSRSS